ncbi:MAG: hypothetical protein CMF23_14020 [Ignavibacteriae bacterium]|nr:hypothetical protein [Ignavibacteriota bacterium]|tara:strand:- start:422 stop:1042 length:621 start_codon:yes stop_codon:yes gene_type:complete
MNTISKIIVLILASSTLYAQSLNKSITWEGKMIGEYLPKLHSDWETTSLGGLISFQIDNNEHFFTTLFGKLNFMPINGGDNFDYSSIRNASLSLSYDPALNNSFNFIISAGIGYTQGKISNATYKYINTFAQLKFDYNINEKITLFTNINNVIDLKNSLFTPSVKVGFIADFIIISFELLQYINWSSQELRHHNFFSAPYINHHNQ